MALDPYSALCGPRTTSIRSKRPTGSVLTSYAPSIAGLFTGNPSIITSVWLASPPRILMFSKFPGLPFRWTSTPGSPWRASPTSTAPSSSISSRVTTLTEEACSETFSSMRVAVTTTGSVSTGPAATEGAAPKKRNAASSTAGRDGLPGILVR